METVFVIGGMGSGKSTAVSALASIGVPTVDLDALGHKVLTLPAVHEELCNAFGSDIVADAQVNRRVLAQRAFASPEATCQLNEITQPRILQMLQEHIQALEDSGHNACVVEASAFDGRDSSFGRLADTVAVVTAPLELRVNRAVARGFDRADVEARIKAQMSDEERKAHADVVFVNDGSREALRDAVISWWHDGR